MKHMWIVMAGVWVGWVQASPASFVEMDEVTTEWRYWSAYNNSIPAPPGQYDSPTAWNAQSASSRTTLTDATVQAGGDGGVQASITGAGELKTFATSTMNGAVPTGRIHAVASAESATRWRATSVTETNGHGFAAAFRFSFDASLTRNPSSDEFLDAAYVEVAFSLYYPLSVEGLPGAEYSSYSVLNHTGLTAFDSQGTYYDVDTGEPIGTFDVQVTNTPVANGYNVQVSGEVAFDGAVGGYHGVSYRMETSASAWGIPGATIADGWNTGSFELDAPGDMVFVYSPIPEPGTAALWGLGGMLGLAAARRRRTRPSAG